MTQERVPGFVSANAAPFPLVVTGMHRSGIAWVTAILDAIGVNMGMHDRAPASAVENRDSQTGNATFPELNHAMLKAATPPDIAGHRDWGWTESERLDRGTLEEFVPAARALIASHRTGSLWGWRDPCATLLLDFWDGLFNQKAHYIFVYRLPWQVADSMQRLGLEIFLERPDYAYRIWSFYNRHLLDFYSRHPDRCLLIGVNAVVGQPDQLIDGLSDKFHLAFAPAPPPNTFKPELFTTQAPDDPLVRLTALAHPDCIDLLRKMDHDADLSNAGQWIVKPRDSFLQSFPAGQLDTDVPLSIVIPCHNHGEFLLEAIASVERNAPRGTELIIVNDGSTDAHTLQILNLLKESGFGVLEQPHSGLSTARNSGIRIARGRYILPLDADNRIRQSFLETAIDILENRPGVGVVHSDWQEFGLRSGLHQVPHFDRVTLLQGNEIDACAVFRKRVWEDCGGYDANTSPLEDWDFWIGALKRGWQFYHWSAVGFDYRVRPNSLITRADEPDVLARVRLYVTQKHADVFLGTERLLSVESSSTPGEPTEHNPPNSFNPLNHPILFATAERLTPALAWHEHIPFAFYLMDVLQPKMLVELGTYYGDSYCAFCQAVKALHLSTRCFAIDTWQGDRFVGGYASDVLGELRTHHDPRYGDFSHLVQSTFDQAAPSFSDGTIDLMHIDGDHSYQIVKHDFEMWLPKMSPRGVILLHDTNVLKPEFGVHQFWNEIRDAYPHFEFLHGGGLGVLAVGKSLPREFIEFVNASSEQATWIRLCFSALGERLGLAFRTNYASKHVSSLVAQVVERQQAVESLGAQLEAQTDKVNALVAIAVERQRAVESLLKQLADRNPSESASIELKEKEQTNRTLILLVGEKQQTIEALVARVADRDSLSSQLNAIYGSKMWRAATIYRSFIERLQSFLQRPIQHPGPAPATRAAEPNIPVEIPLPSKNDIIYFARIDWKGRFGEQYQFVDQLAHDGHRVFYVPMHSAGSDQTMPIVRSLGERIFELVLPREAEIRPEQVNLANPSLGKSHSALLEFVRKQNIAEAICVIQHPFWTPLACELKSRFGWKMVYDRVGDDRNLPSEQGESVKGACDLSVTSSLDQNENDAKAGLNSFLYSGASDSAHQLELRLDALYGVASIIVVTWNNLDLTRQCLRSVLDDGTYPNFQVIVIDNASSDGTVEYLKDLSGHDSRVQTIFNGTNLGFAKANNMGLKRTKESEFIILLNNDTVVPRGWLARLLRHARKPEVGLVGPVTNWTGNEAKIDVSYTDLKDMESFARSYVTAHDGQVFDIRVLAMYCVAMRRAIADTVGLVDERFERGGFEDDDYARRVRQAGYRVICAEDVFVHHQGMASFSKLEDAEYKGLFGLNKKRYEDKWGEPWTPHKARVVGALPLPASGASGNPSIPPLSPNLSVRRRAGFRTFPMALKLYLANHVIANIPSFRIRHWYYRRVLHYAIGRNSSIHMGTFVTGDYITVGDNVVINRRCYLDGRIGVEIQDNVSISPEVCLVSMEHDPNDPHFSTRGGKVVIEKNVWIGMRAVVSPGITVHEGAVIGAGAIVTKDIGPYRIAVGVPAREIKDRNRDIQYRCEYLPWFDTDVQRYL